MTTEERMRRAYSAAVERSPEGYRWSMRAPYFARGSGKRAMSNEEWMITRMDCPLVDDFDACAGGELRSAAEWSESLGVEVGLAGGGEMSLSVFLDAYNSEENPRKRPRAEDEYAEKMELYEDRKKAHKERVKALEESKLRIKRWVKFAKKEQQERAVKMETEKKQREAEKAKRESELERMQRLAREEKIDASDYLQLCEWKRRLKNIDEELKAVCEPGQRPRKPAPARLVDASVIRSAVEEYMRPVLGSRDIIIPASLDEARRFCKCPPRMTAEVAQGFGALRRSLESESAEEVYDLDAGIFDDLRRERLQELEVRSDDSDDEFKEAENKDEIQDAEEEAKIEEVVDEIEKIATVQPKLAEAAPIKKAQPPGLAKAAERRRAETAAKKKAEEEAAAKKKAEEEAAAKQAPTNAVATEQAPTNVLATEQTPMKALAEAAKTTPKKKSAWARAAASATRVVVGVKNVVGSPKPVGGVLEDMQDLADNREADLLEEAQMHGMVE